MGIKKALLRALNKLNKNFNDRDHHVLYLAWKIAPRARSRGKRTRRGNS